MREQLLETHGYMYVQCSLVTLIHICSDNSERVDSKLCDGRQLDWSASVCVVDSACMGMYARHGEKRG
jgi:hypothetical protein